MNNADMPAMAIPPVQFTDVDGSRLVATGTNGLTKREHFAGLAMQGLLAHYGSNFTDDPAVWDAIQYADALLKALEQDNE
tara:strand:- start:131 stop:370 length:240 start_codon:yes stop_codon:yes gene_type:complete